MGIPIGWPNASAKTNPIGPVTGWFSLEITCIGSVFVPGTWTQEIINTTLQTGQYVYYPAGNTRVLLGEFTATPPEALATAIIDSSEGFNSCGI